MTRTVPALKKGDELVILQLPSHKTVIFYNNQNQGELDDKCGDAVFRVWLDPSTRYQRVRKDLLKE